MKEFSSLPRFYKYMKYGKRRRTTLIPITFSIQSKLILGHAFTLVPVDDRVNLLQSIRVAIFEALSDDLFGSKVGMCLRLRGGVRIESLLMNRVLFSYFEAWT